jgi:hypothetical protein
LLLFSPQAVAGRDVRAALALARRHAQALGDGASHALPLMRVADSDMVQVLILFSFTSLRVVCFCGVFARLRSMETRD